MIFARLCPSLPCAQRKTAPYFQIHLNVEPSERCSIDSIAPYPPKKNKLEQSVTTTSDSSEILLVDFFGGLRPSPSPKSPTHQPSPTDKGCLRLLPCRVHLRHAWYLHATSVNGSNEGHISVALFEVWWRYDGDLMRNGDFLIFVEGFSKKSRSITYIG